MNDGDEFRYARINRMRYTFWFVGLFDNVGLETLSQYPNQNFCRARMHD